LLLAVEFTLEDFINVFLIFTAFVAVLIGFEYMRYKSGSDRSITTALISLKQKYRIHLQEHSLYYQILPAKEKKRFEKRVQRFINLKQFIGRDFEQVTDEMKALIAGAAVQLTFGLPGIFLSHFKKILIYPNNYYSTINLKFHKGEVNPKHGIIVLSWHSFVEGFLDHNDSMNLGLHEMAHALRLENNIFNKEFKFLNQEALQLWTTEAEKEIEKSKSSGQSFFRRYAFTDEQEFFAVAVENFFEKPADFSRYNLALYRALARLLNQDPLKNYAAL